MISWDEIEIKEKIGESAQNEVYKAKIKKNNKEVAIKIYGNKVTSDGYPDDDMQTNVLAGNCPHLIEVIGKIKDMPNNGKALILSLIPSEFDNLGLPPNFDSCTRDTFLENTLFSIKFIKTVINDMKQALVHLHEKGIMHGDIYSHNILVNQKGYSYLGDFGAASIYDPKKDLNRQKIDVRAFGCLIEDLLSKCDEKENIDYKSLNKMRQYCLDDFSKRPLFKDLLFIK